MEAVDICLGAWHVLPSEFHPQAIGPMEANDTRLESSIYSRALATRETVLYLHGNAATRGFFRRVDLCKGGVKSGDACTLQIAHCFSVCLLVCWST